MTRDKENWWQQGNFYSLYIDKFAGDIDGLIERLDYFVALGIDCLHLLPHYPSPRCDGGYDITDYTGVRPELGTVEDFTRLCSEAHKRGLRIMVDLVLNHVSEEHPWFQAARASKASPSRDWFLWSDTGTEYGGAPNVFPDFKSSNWITNEATGDYYYATFKPCQPDLNWSNDAVLAAMIDVVDTLVGYGVDGFRLDAIMNLVEVEGTNSVGVPATHTRIKEIRCHLDMHHPGVILLGEVIGTTDYSKNYFGNSDECHLSYNFELMNEMWYALLCAGRRERLATVLEAARAVPKNSSWMTFLRNHDSLSLITLDKTRRQELLTLVDPDHQYGFSHNTETVQRLYSLCGEDEAVVRDALAMLYAVPSATVMYYGDEIAMSNASLPPGEDDMRAVVRGPFDWEEARRQQADPQSLWRYTQSLLRKRRQR